MCGVQPNSSRAVGQTALRTPERIAVKVACCVLMGERGCEAPDLPDHNLAETAKDVMLGI